MPDFSSKVKNYYDAKRRSSKGWFSSEELMSVDSSTSRSLFDEPQVQMKDNKIKIRTDLKNIAKNIGSSRSSRRRSRSSIKQQTKSPHYMKATSCSGGKKGPFQASPHSSETSFDSSDQSWSPSHFKSDSSASSSRKSSRTLSRTSSFRIVKILTNRTSIKSKKSLSNCHQVPSKPTCSSTLKDLKFPEHVELHPGQNESDRISKVKVCSYHHCSLNKHDDPSPLVKRVYRRRRLLNSHKSIRLDSESTNVEKTSVDRTAEVRKIPFSTSPGASVREGSHLKQDDGVFRVNEAIEYIDLAEIVFGETSFPERSYQETIDIMRKYSTLELDTLVTTSKCCNCIEREWDESTSVSDDLDSKVRSVTASVVCNPEVRNDDFHHMLSLPLLIKPADGNVTSVEDENFNRELSKNESFAIEMTSVSVEAKCSSELSSASASRTRMELEENLQEKDDKANQHEDLDNLSCPIGDIESRNYTPAKDAEPKASAQILQVAQVPKEKHRSMWSLIHRHMISDVPAEFDTKLTSKADEEIHKNGDNNLYAAESMTTKDADNQDLEVHKAFAIKFVREAIERILLPEVQDQSSDDQSITSEVCTEENFIESESKNGECDMAFESHEGSITRENIEKQKVEGQAMNKAEKKAPKHWSNLKRWILLQRFIKELEKVRKFNPRKPRYLQLEPDPEAEKVNLKHQTEEERKRAEEWMLDYALQQAISQLGPTQKRKVGLLVTAFETVVPPKGGNMQVTFPKLKTSNAEHLQVASKGNALVSNLDKTLLKAEAVVVSEPKVGEKYSTCIDERSADDDSSMLKNDNTQETIVLCQKLDEVSSTSSDKLSMEGKAKLEVKEEEHSKLEHKARINVSKSSEEEKECGGSNDSLKGTSSTTSNLTNDGHREQESDMSVSSATQCEATKSSSVCIDENKKITEAEDDDGTHRRQVNKQKYISLWQMLSQHVLSDVASIVGSELLAGTDDEVEDNKSLAEMITESSLLDFSETKDDVDTNTSHYQRNFSRNDAVNLIREAVSNILTAPIQDDSSETQSITSDILPDEELQDSDHTECGEQTRSNSFCENSRRNDMGEGVTVLSQETKEPAANTKSKLEPTKSKNWSKLKKLILLKRSINVLERKRKLNPRPPHLLPPTHDQEHEKADLRHKMTDEKKKAEQWMLDNAIQHMVTKLTPARRTRVAMLVEAFESVVPFPEV